MLFLPIKIGYILLFPKLVEKIRGMVYNGLKKQRSENMYRDKTRDHRHTKLTAEEALEIKAAFDSGVAMCFAFDEESAPQARVALVSRVLEGYGDVVLAKCDYVYFGSETKAYGNMLLLVKKDTDKDSFNSMVDGIILPSGAVKTAVFMGKTTADGTKKAVRRELGCDKPSVVKRANLLVDGSKLVLTVRNSVVAKP